jgi:uncharacterized protein
VNEKDRWRLEHMRDAIEKIDAIAAQRNGPAASMALDAVLYNITVIGEAVSALSAACRELEPGIPWGTIKGMRNLLAHQYFSVDEALVWTTVDEHVPALKAAVVRLLSREE